MLTICFIYNIIVAWFNFTYNLSKNTVEVMQSLPSVTLLFCNTALEVKAMSDSAFEISITLPLYKWEKCPLDYNRILDFCRMKNTELMLKERCNLSPTQNTLALIPSADLYKFCIDILNTARDHKARISSIETHKKNTTFTFNFKSPKICDDFYVQIKKLCNEYHIVDSTED